MPVAAAIPRAFSVRPPDPPDRAAKAAKVELREPAVRRAQRARADQRALEARPEQVAREARQGREVPRGPEASAAEAPVWTDKRKRVLPGIPRR